MMTHCHTQCVLCLLTHLLSPLALTLTLVMALRQLQDTNPAKFSRQEVTRTPLGRLLASGPGHHHQVVIPVFQRPYCWPEPQLQPW